MGPHFYGHTAHVMIFHITGPFGGISRERSNESRGHERLGNIHTCCLDFEQVSSD